MQQTGRKIFVLDTSVLLSSPKAMFTFDEHEVVLPLVVITELEGKRHDPELGYPARTALRAIEALRGNGALAGAVALNKDGGTFRIEINHVDQSGLPDAVRHSKSNDARILAVASNLKDQGREVVVVSKDMPMRILAEVMGLAAEEYRGEQEIVSDAYTGMMDAHVSESVIDDLYTTKWADLADLGLDVDVPVNTGLRLHGPRSSALAILGADKRLTPVVGDTEAFGVAGRSAEQRVALQHLLNPDIGIVSLGGLAGAGKSFLALAAGLEAVLEKKTQKKIIVFRPLYAVGGQDLGFLPGSAEEKMGPWGAAVFDTLQSMTSEAVVEEVLARGLLEVLPLTHIRGRTLSDSFVIVDEAQSLERPVLLTALSRLGERSKVVLSHDTAQRDNLRVGRYDGIAAVVERLKGEPLFAHTTFTKSERGPIAAMVTRLLDDMV